MKLNKKHPSIKINDQFKIKENEIKENSVIKENWISLKTITLKKSILCYDDIANKIYLCTGVEYTYDGIYLLNVLAPIKCTITATKSIRRI